MEHDDGDPKSGDSLKPAMIPSQRRVSCLLTGRLLPTIGDNTSDSNSGVTSESASLSRSLPSLCIVQATKKNNADMNSEGISVSALISNQRRASWLPSWKVITDVGNNNKDSNAGGTFEPTMIPSQRRVSCLLSGRVLQDIGQNKGDTSFGVTTETKETRALEFVQPDGGLYALLVLFCISVCRGIIFGIHNSFGIIFVHLNKIHEQDPRAAMKVSLVGSIGFGIIFFLSPVTGILCDKLGLRLTAFIGSVIATLGMFSSSFFVNNLLVLYCTYGLFGAGSSLIYTPSLAILGHYFNRRIGIANGLVQAGGCVFSIFMPPLLTFLFGKIGVANTLRFLSGLIASLMICVLSFKPLLKVLPTESKSKNFLDSVFHVDNFRNRKYIIWALSVTVAFLGMYVPFYYVIEYAEDNDIHGTKGHILLICIAISSGIARLLCGKISDLPGLNPILLMQVSYGALGGSIMMFSCATYFDPFTFHVLIICSLVFGFCEGCCLTMIVPTALKLCGPIGATQGPNAIEKFSAGF